VTPVLLKSRKMLCCMTAAVLHSRPWLCATFKTIANYLVLVPGWQAVSWWRPHMLTI